MDFGGKFAGTVNERKERRWSAVEKTQKNFEETGRNGKSEWLEACLLKRGKARQD
jgi:hypothetical protein